MAVTRRTAADFSANVGLPVYESAANTVALWADSTVEPLGIIKYVDESDPQDVVVATQGERCQFRPAGNLAAGVGLLTTEGNGSKLTTLTADSTQYTVVRNLHKAAMSEDDLVEGIVHIVQITTPAE